MIKFTAKTEAVQAKFAELGSASPKVMHALDAFARVLKTRIQLAFRQGRAPSGAAWAPLNPFFRKGQPLMNTRHLYGSVQTRRDGDGVIVGTNLKTPGGAYSLGAIHQFGATVVPKKAGGLLGPIPAGKGFIFLKKAVIPARPFMPMDGAGNVLLPAAWAKAAINAMGSALELDK